MSTPLYMDKFFIVGILAQINSAVNKYYVKQWTDFLKHDKIFL